MTNVVKHSKATEAVIEVTCDGGEQCIFSVTDNGVGFDVNTVRRGIGMDGQPAVFLKAKPKTDLSKCTKCGLCSTLCPMGSIDAADTSNITGICIKCQACVKS